MPIPNIRPGRWAHYPSEKESVRYQVNPVLPSMFDHFMGWAKQQYPAIEPKIDQSEGMISATFSVHGSVFTLDGRSDYKRLSRERLNQPLLKTMGTEFDGAFRIGRFQDGFYEMNTD